MILFIQNISVNCVDSKYSLLIARFVRKAIVTYVQDCVLVGNSNIEQSYKMQRITQLISVYPHFVKTNPLMIVLFRLSLEISTIHPHL